MSTIDADDLAMLAAGFEAAMLDAEAPAATVVALHDLGWGELLDAAPAQAIATTFALLGSTASPAGLIDDVAAHALGLPRSTTRCVMLPAPAAATPPAQRTDGDEIVVDGVVSSNFDDAATVVVAIATATGIELVSLDGSSLTTSPTDALDPAGAYRRLRGSVPSTAVRPVEASGSWNALVSAGRVALAHELNGAARTMLESARRHALDREQFGRAVAGFQAVRHKLAEAFVQIEGATAVADTWDDTSDRLVAALAKSLAGQAARTTATNAQQVLAGIGFTAEHDFHRFLKRTLAIDQLFGSANTIPGEIGHELIRRGDAPRLVEL